MKKFITFGEAMVMFVAQQEGELAEQRDFKKFMAGAETNVGIGMARLGYESTFISRVGKDSFGRFIVQDLEREGVNTDQVVFDDVWPTGYQVKSKVSTGDPQIEYYRKFTPFRQIAKDQINTDWLSQVDHLHTTGIPLALSVSTYEYGIEIMRKARENQLTISFDPNLRPTLWSSTTKMRQVINEAAGLADWILPGLSEGQYLTGLEKPREIADFYLNKGVNLVVIKLGKEGAYYCDSREKEGMIKGIQAVKVIDSVGAGDGFAVGIISGLLEGLTLKKSVERGNAIGALAIKSQGDHDGLPNREILNNYIKENYHKQ